MPYLVKRRGLEIVCDTEEEVARLVHKLEAKSVDVSKPLPRAPKRKANGTYDPRQGSMRQAEAMRKSWQEATEFAEKHGLTRNNARSLLAEAREKDVEPETLVEKYRR